MHPSREDVARGRESQPAPACVGAESASDLGGIGARAQLADLAVVLLGLAVDRVLEALHHRLEACHTGHELWVTGRLAR